MFKIQNLILLLLIVIGSGYYVIADNKINELKSNVIVGASQISNYENLIKNKRIGVIANHTSVIFKDNDSYTHLIDSLLSLDFNIKKIFAPEHGFRGTEPNGANIDDEIDLRTGLKIISLHGKNRNYGEIDDNDVRDIDILIFDIQDVGVRFYTHISVLHYVMETSARNNIPLIILDRPNPNGHYVDGPVLNLDNKSFVGMHEVPIVYGLTIGEYANMINQEEWLTNGIKSELYVVKLKNYDRNKVYELPIKPSPNLPNKSSVNLYPSLCLFEGTNISAGRGTNMQFQIYGSPFLNKKLNEFKFTPKKNLGSKYPKHENILCYGKNLSETKKLEKINLKYIIDAFNESANKVEFFNSYFVKLAGVNELKKQIINGIPENEIRKSWKKDLDKFKLMRKKYLIYQNKNE
tara:strand:+ start:884 stop:2104 length:1221 start_codon:yes stop_codon:yes gene_type:complete